jgi:hypothetical protein
MMIGAGGVGGVVVVPAGSSGDVVVVVVPPAVVVVVPSGFVVVVEGWSVVVVVVGWALALTRNPQVRAATASAVRVMVMVILLGRGGSKRRTTSGAAGDADRRPRRMCAGKPRCRAESATLAFQALRVRHAPPVLVALALAGCAAPGDEALDVVFDPCGSALAPAGDTLARERAAVVAAAEIWNDALGADLAIVAPDAPDALPIRFEEAAPLFRGIYLDEEGAVVINRSIADDGARAIAIAHELGHAFGMWHVEDRPSVMNPGNLTTGPTADDVAALTARWGACAPASPR